MAGLHSFFLYVLEELTAGVPGAPKVPASQLPRLFPSKETGAIRNWAKSCLDASKYGAKGPKDPDEKLLKGLAKAIVVANRNRDLNMWGCSEEAFWKANFTTPDATKILAAANAKVAYRITSDGETFMVG